MKMFNAFKRLGGGRNIQTSAGIALLPKQTKLFIDGQFVESSTGKTFNTIDPRTEEVICEVPEASVDDVDAAVTAARNAFDKGPWPRMSGYDRGRVLNKLADLIDQNTKQLAYLETLDNGKPLFFSTNADIPLTAMHFRYYAGWADKISGRTLGFHSPNWGYTLHEPVGVCGQIIPWNFPMLMAAWKIAPALAAGNTVVLKLSEKTPLTGLVLAELCQEAGIPNGAINILSGSGAVGEAIVRHDGVDKVAFTGSTGTALKITKAVTDVGRIKPISTELGGKSPAIVFADADLDLAAENVYFGLFFNHGQCCCASSRCYVHESIKEEFLEKLLTKVESRKVGDPFEEVDQGPQVDKLQFDRVMGFIEKGKVEGNLLIGGQRYGNKGYYVQPTVFDNIPDTGSIMRDEIFGPVLAMNTFTDTEEVIARANDSTYGLAAGVFSQNVDTINQVTRALKAGTVWVNCYNIFDNHAPFGGYKNSGVGRDKGEYALDNYTVVKCVTMPLVGDPTFK
jgi:aldehyde dehydrogenase (NAD+)